MELNKWPRQTDIKDHDIFGDEHFGTEAPCVVYEKKPIVDPNGNAIEGLYSAWVILNNPAQYNSYTTEMVKGVIAGFHKASMDRSVVGVVFTAAGDKAFCTGGNTKEYAEYYSGNPSEYMFYMDLFNGMVDGILNCKKPVICRVNGMRVAGGQEIGMACDVTISSDLAIFGQAGPKHGSAPVGGSTDFLHWYLGMEQAMWNCISCEMWSAYKMEGNNGIEAAKLILKNQPDIKIIFLTVFEDTEFVRQGLQAGAAGYILKHVSREKLVDSIQRVHRGETIIDPAVFNRIVNDYIKYSKSNEKQEQPEDTTPTVELTPREREILHFLVKGMTNKEISAATHLAVDTIKTHLRNIFRKMGIKNRSQAITQGLKLLKIDQG